MEIQDQRFQQPPAPQTLLEMQARHASLESELVMTLVGLPESEVSEFVSLESTYLNAQAEHKGLLNACTHEDKKQQDEAGVRATQALLSLLAFNAKKPDVYGEAFRTRENIRKNMSELQARIMRIQGIQERSRIRLVAQ